MSKIEVDAIEPQSGTTLTLGASGDSVNIASGATITDFASTGIDDNATSTAITIDSGEKVGIGTTTIPEVLTVNKSSDGAITGLSINNDYPTSSTASAGTGSGIRFGVNDASFTSAFGDARGSEILSVTTLTNGRTRDIVFKTDNGGTLGEKMRILASGGITFNGDTAAANALDDYEEGTWSPAFIGSISGASGVNFNDRVGTYVKIGNSVTVHIFLGLASWSSGPSGNISLGTLPFTATSTASYRAAGSIGYSANFSQGPGGAIITSGSTAINLRKWTSTSAQSNITNNLTGSDMSGDEQIIVTATYEVD